MNTKQQEFDAVVSHLYTQGMPAKNGNTCAYRSTDGLSCAVGCRIPDEAYDDTFEGQLVSSVIKRAENLDITLPIEITEYYTMFDLLQEVHDTWDAYADGQYSFNDLVTPLETVAAKAGVTFNDPRVAA